jgi:hypothetical protein
LRRYAIIPSNGRGCLYECLDAIYPQVDEVIVVYTGDDGLTVRSQDTFYIMDEEDLPTIVEKNISAWWNVALKSISSTSPGGQPWRVAILNDDAIVSPNWFEAVETRMEETGAAAACSGPSTHLLVEPGPVPLHLRMQGFAFMLRGELELRANESLYWYFSDDYIDWESRKLGGMAMTDQAHVRHLYPNGQVTPEIHVRIAHDAQAFKDLYGTMPW